MDTIDWVTMSCWVIGTSAFGACFHRYVENTRDYLLAGKRLRWWQIAMAQSADAVDATDFVATTGQGYRTGLSQIGFAWWGMGIGSILLSRYVAPLLCRTGVYTNAEYLELRYTKSLRIASAVIQLLYRFVAMALVVYAMATVFKVIVGIDLWRGVWAAMVLTLGYVLASGQLGVAMAAIPQMALMVITSIAVMVCASMEIGGWRGFSSHMAELGGLLHLAGHKEAGVPGGVYLWGMILTLVTYPIVNQTVAQRLVAARSEVDARKGTIASLLPWCIITGVSTVVGIMAVILLPGLSNSQADFIFPLYMQKYFPPGVLGLGVAALVVASMSTGAGIGTAIAGLMAVDLLGYRKRAERDERYHLMMTRLFASLSIVCGTLFAMFIPSFGGMIPFYVAFTGTFFLPLTVPYVGGALYKHASRGAGMASLLGGTGLGLVLFAGSSLLPPLLGHPQWRPFWVLGFAVVMFILWSMIENQVRGPVAKAELANILNSFELGKSMTPREVEGIVRSSALEPWEGQNSLDFKILGVPDDVPWHSRPATFEVSAAVVLVALMLWWW